MLDFVRQLIEPLSRSNSDNYPYIGLNSLTVELMVKIESY